MRYFFLFISLLVFSSALSSCGGDEQTESIDCITSNDCPVGYICSESKCVLGVDNNTDGDQESDQQQYCGECCTDEDCDTGFHCTDNLCIRNENTGCVIDDDCLDDMICVDGFCKDATTDGDNEDSETETEAASCVSNADCTDYLFCNGTELCGTDGKCKAGELPCDDNIECTSDSCDEELNHCENVSDHAKCNDGISCTSDVCSSIEGCINTADDAACEDDELCDPDSEFSDESTGCMPKPECDTDDECDDGLYCNGTEKCVSRLCQAGEAVDCGDSIGCTADVCDEDNDTCTNDESDELCQDGNLCNGAEICDPDNANADSSTGCIEGTIPDCDDSVDCTDDSCDAVLGCVNDPNNANCADAKVCHSEQGCIDPECTVDADCSDNDTCNGEEVCNLGLCVAGTALDCNVNLSGNHDTASCDSSTGCQYACEADYDDCNSDLGQASGNGCEIYVPTVGMGETGARSENSCNDGSATWGYYEGSCTEYSADGKEMIFKYVATETAEMVAGAESDDYDVDVYILTSPCDISSCIAYGADTGDDYAAFNAVAGNTYYIVVDGFDENGSAVCGNFNVGVELRENTDCETTGRSHYATVLFTILLLLGWVITKRRRNNS